MSQNVAQYVKQPRLHARRVFFEGTGALVRGQGVCYNRDYGTAANDEGRRDKHVELPASGNNMWFAGVTAEAYAANAAGQWITIYEPGSVCPVAIGINTTVGSTLLTCSVDSADQGIFTRAGLRGRGSALALQTVASAGTGEVPVSASLNGTASIGAGNLTLTKTALFTNAVVGDKVVVLGGSVTATGATAVTVGEYTLATRTSADVGVLSASPCAAASIVNVYVKRGNPVALCLLLDGPESGLIQHVASITAAATSPAAMVGGTTFVVGGQTIAGDTVITLADAVQGVERKAFQLNGALTTSTAAITSGNMRKATYALTATFKLAVDLDYALLAWAGGSWSVIGGDGTAA